MLANLVENAIKYTSTGGVVVVARARGAQVWMDVCDTGLGIAPEHLEHIFDEFYQVSNPGRDRSHGLGIGLSIVRRLSDLLGHPVLVQSRLGHGSRFRIVLPAAAALAVLPPAHFMAGGTSDGVLQRPPLSDLPQRVLLIDDEADIGLAVAALLGSCGVAVTVVQHANGAIAAFELAVLNSAPFDCLICDYRLAEGADGLEVALALRQRFDPGLPVLLVTGETAPERLQRVRDSGLAVLFKPVPGGTLLTALTAIKRTSQEYFPSP
jgi:CheY-like chemotaxis protein